MTLISRMKLILGLVLLVLTKIITLLLISGKIPKKYMKLAWNFALVREEEFIVQYENCIHSICL